jgi:hypothetical protein
MGRTVSYVKDPVVVAFKTSDRKNAKLKIKVFRNKTIDDLLDCDFVTPGIDENAVILAVCSYNVLCVLALHCYFMTC